MLFVWVVLLISKVTESLRLGLVVKCLEPYFNSNLTPRITMEIPGMTSRWSQMETLTILVSISAFIWSCIKFGGKPQTNLFIFWCNSRKWVRSRDVQFRGTVQPCVIRFRQIDLDQQSRLESRWVCKKSEFNSKLVGYAGPQYERATPQNPRAGDESKNEQWSITVSRNRTKVQ